MPHRNKHSSLLQTFLDYGCKKFYKIDLWEEASLGYYPIKVFNKLSVFPNQSSSVILAYDTGQIVKAN